MTERWYRTQDLAGLPGMKGARSIRLYGASYGWVSREVSWGKRKVKEWLESSLPNETQEALRQARGDDGGRAAEVLFLDSSAPAPEGGDSAPGSSSRATGRPPSALILDEGAEAIADARREILKSFESWHAGQGKVGVVTAMRNWAPIYNVSEDVVSPATKELIPTVSAGSLQRWRRDYDAGGTAALVPAKAGRKAGIDSDPAIIRKIEAQLFRRARHVTARHIQRVIETECKGHEVPSIASIRRWLKKWHAVPENRRALSAVEDPDGHRSRMTPAFGSANAGITALNEVWELDSTPADVICSDGKRYAIVGAIDVWPRRARCLVVPTSKAEAVAALMGRCLRDWGVPDEVVTDGGAEYVSRHLVRIFDELDIAHRVCDGGRPDQKPHIERFYKTISRELFAMMPGFVGHDVADRKRIESRKSFAERRGQDNKAAFRCDLTAREVQQWINDWCEHEYGRREHSETGVSPFERAATWKGEITPVDPRGLDVLLAPPAGDNGYRTVNKDGLHIGNRIFIAEAIGNMVGARVHVRVDLTDPTRIWVFTPEVRKPKFICIAHDRSGLAPEEQREIAVGAKRCAGRTDSASRKRAAGLERSEDPDGSMARVLEDARKNAERVVAFPRTGEVHRTDATDAAAEAEAAAEKEAEEAPKRAEASRRHIDVLKQFYNLGGKK